MIVFEVLAGLLCLGGGYCLWRGKFSVPFLRRVPQQWSIGMYIGDSPFSLRQAIPNPVLTASDVTDIPADFVADPFLFFENSRYYLFFEVCRRRGQGQDISLAESADGLHWNYKQVVLHENCNLSYPVVFKWENDYYMLPETSGAKQLRLYKAARFPTEWKLAKVLLEGIYNDATIFYHHNKWWLFAETSVPHANNKLSLFFADALMGPWKEHPKSPVMDGNAHHARPAGRVLNDSGRLFRFAQDDAPHYGLQIWVFEITKLNETEYEEKMREDQPFLKGTGSGWNAGGMHTVDFLQVEKGRWIACADGWKRRMVFDPAKF